MDDGAKPRTIITGQHSSGNNEVKIKQNLYVIEPTDFSRCLQNPARVTLESIDIDKPPHGKSWAKVIDSPRSLEAFRRAGIYARELDPVDVAGLERSLKARFGAGSVNHDLLYLRIEHANKNRRSKFNMVKSVSRSSR